MVTSEAIEQKLLDNGYTISNPFPGYKKWYTYPEGAGGGQFEFAAARYARTLGELPSVSREEAEEIVASAKGQRLDINPPPPQSMLAGIKAVTSLPAGEIVLRSSAYQHASAMIDAAAFGDVFDYRREVLGEHFPQFSKLPCDVAAAACPVVREVWAGAVHMGRSVTYPVFVSPGEMITYARMGEGAEVIQYSDKPLSSYELYKCWIIPNGRRAVWAMDLGDPNGSGNLPAWIRLLIQPLADVTVGWIKDIQREGAWARKPR